MAATPNVSFAYDSVGNRTSMTDGLGSVSYSYNTLSQLTSETRTFTGVGSFALSYAYNLAGELTSITNPWSSVVGYAYDKTGRVTAVSGSGPSSAASYAGALSYRAFGLKGMSYGNGRTLSMQYDNRLRVTDWTVPSVLGWQYGYSDVGENTGRVMFAKNTASSTTGGQRDDTLDRSYDYDHLGRLIVSHTGYEARLHMNRQQSGDPTTYGSYSQAYGYDQLGNMTVRYGWGGWDAGYVNWAPTYTNNRLNTNPATGAAMLYDSSGNLTNDGYQNYSYDATGQQAYASGAGLTQSYDGDRLRVAKTESGVTTYYLRSTVLGGQVVGEINSSGAWTRGYVYAGGQMLAIQSSGVNWVHQDPVTKSQRITNSSGTVTSTIDLDPWGGETAASSNQAFQPHRFTSYERDANSGDEAMMRRYTGKWHRFDQPDLYEGGYDATDPQSFNRYAYTQNDPVNFIDPSGLFTTSNTCGSWAQDPQTREWVWIPCSTNTVTVTGSWDDMSDYLPNWTSNDFFILVTLLGGGLEGFGAGIEPPNSRGGTVNGSATSKDPCADVKASDLIYDRVRKYKKKNAPGYIDQTSEQHIRARHMNPASGASQYFGSFHAVLNTNAYTFEFGTRSANSTGTSIYFELKFPLPIVGTDRDEHNRPTGYNTLILEKDCKTVQTSHPGRAWH